MGDLLNLLPNVSSWKLGEDVALLEAMQGLASSMGTTSKQLQERIDRLARETERAHTRLLTIQNNFVHLSNVKFIEARVYEDSEEAVDDQAVRANDETPTEETLIAEALGCGAKLLEVAFEKVDIEDSDSDGEEEEGAKIISVMQPKNPFHIRSLPAVVGSKAWLDDDKIGLVEEEEAEEAELSECSDEEEVDQEVEKDDDSEFSQSDEEDTQSKPTSKILPPTVKQSVLDDSDSEFSDDDDDELFKPKPAPPVTSPKVENGQDHTKSLPTSDGENHSEETDEDMEEPSESKSTFSQELSKKLGLAPPDPKQGEEGDNTDGDAIEQSPKKTQPMKKSLLFDSSDSEDDLFSGKPALPKKAAKPKSSPGAEKVMEKAPPPPPPSSEKPKETLKEVEPEQKSQIEPKTSLEKDVPARKPLFGSSSEDEDDIFANLTAKAPAPKTAIVAVDSDDSDDDIFAPRPAASAAKEEEHINFDNDGKPSLPEAKKPFGGISMFGSGFDPTSALKTEQTSSDPTSVKSEDGEEEEDDIFNPLSARPSPPSIAFEGDVGEVKLPQQAPDEAAHEAETEELEKTTPESVEEGEIENSSPPALGLTAKTLATKEDDTTDSGAALNSPAGDLPVLTTLTKSRSRGSAGRRPPSRSARKKAVESASETIDLEDEADEGGSVSSSSKGNEATTAGVSSKTDDDELPAVKKPIGGISMFGAGFNPSAALRSMKSRNEEMETKSQEEVEANAVTTREENGGREEDNLLLDKKETILGGTNYSDKKVSPPDLFSEADDDDDDGLFAPPPTKDGLVLDAKEEQGQEPVSEMPSKTSGLFDDDEDDDDFFNAPPKLEGSRDKGQAKKDIFGFDEDDSDDDLFSNMASGVKPSLKPNPLANILGDDSDDDLFSSLIPKSTK